MEDHIFPQNFGLWGVFIVIKGCDDGSRVQLVLSLVLLKCLEVLI
jgi:hypothetical protein